MMVYIRLLGMNNDVYQSVNGNVYQTIENVNGNVYQTIQSVNGDVYQRDWWYVSECEW